MSVTALPAETWGKIFEHCLSYDHTSVTTFMAVNRAWRGIASGTPQLWTTVVFDHQKHFTDLARARSQIQNSGVRPLDVRIVVPAGVNDTTPITKLLREHVRRVRTLDIRVPGHEAAEEIVSSIGKGQPAPLLEQLNIAVDEELSEAVPSFAALCDSFYPSPLLTQLSLPAHPLPETTIPHLPTLTSLTIDAVVFGWDIDIDKIFSLLESVSRLEHFTFKGSDNFSYNSTSRLDHPRVVSMPRLISADVSAPGCGLDIFRVLDAPLLTNVRFDAWRDEEHTEDWVESLTAPISASLRRLSVRSPKIKRLELRSTAMLNPLEDYQWLLGNAFPQLEVLRLDTADVTDDVLRSGSTPFLKRLELRACEGVSGTALLRYVEGRDKDFELLIDACPGVSQDDIAALSEVVRVELKSEDMDKSSIHIDT